MPSVLATFLLVKMTWTAAIKSDFAYWNKKKVDKETHRLGETR